MRKVNDSDDRLLLPSEKPSVRNNYESDELEQVDDYINRLDCEKVIEAFRFLESGDLDSFREYPF